LTTTAPVDKSKPSKNYDKYGDTLGPALATCDLEAGANGGVITGAMFAQAVYDGYEQKPDHAGRDSQSFKDLQAYAASHLIMMDEDAKAKWAFLEGFCG